MPVDDALASAIRRHEERLAKDPSSLAFAQLADLYRKAGRTAEAVTLCREGLARYPHYSTARLILAKTLLAEQDLEGALAEVQAILQSSPKDVQCHRLAAEALRRLGRIEAAVEHLEAVVAIDPADRESRALLGLLRADAGSGEAAGVARLLADDTFITAGFAAVCLEQGLTDEAVMIFTRMLRKNPDDSQAREQLETALRGRSRRKG